MTSAHIKSITLANFKNKKVIFWVLVRILSAFGPLIATYLFADAVSAIENAKPVTLVLQVVGLLLLVECCEHLLRLSSKTRISGYTESVLIDIHEDLAKDFVVDSPHRKELIQAFRNYTKAIRDLVTYLYNNGLQGFVSFAFIPVILFFIDIKIFFIQIILMLFYMIVTLWFARLYEKKYENFDKSREYYFAALIERNNVEAEASYIRKNSFVVENVTFFNWFTLQNIISFVSVLIFVLVVRDIYNGTKQIADLILIVGYSKETKVFLNDISGSIEKLMQVKAGAERVVAISKKESLSIHKD